MDTSQKDLLVVLVLGLVGLAFIWVPLPGGVPLFLLSYLLILVLPGLVLISYLKPDMNLPNRLIYGFVLSLALLMGIFFFTVLFELYWIADYLPSFLLIFSILVASANYLRKRSEEKRDEGQLTLFESIERAQKVRELVNHHEDDVSEEPEPVTPEPAISEFYHKPGEQTREDEPIEHLPEATVQEAPKRVPEDVKPLREEHIQNGYEEEKPEPVVSHPMWREGLPRKGGFRYWDLLIVLLLSGASIAFLILDPLNKPEYTSIISYLILLFLLGYSLVVSIYPDPKRMGLGSRLIASILISLLIFAVSFLLWTLNLLSFLPLPLFYVLALVTLVVLLVAALRRRSALREEEEPEPDEDQDIFILHDPETLKARAEREAEALPEEEPVIIPDHVILQEEPTEEAPPREEGEEKSQPEELEEQDIEEIIPELAVLRELLEKEKTLDEDEIQPPEEPEPEYEEVEVIIPDHVTLPEDTTKKPETESTLKTRETEVKAVPTEEILEKPEVTEELPLKEAEEPSEKPEVLTEKPPAEPEVAEKPPAEKKETEEPSREPQEVFEEPPTEKEPQKESAFVLPWIERQKKPAPHVYEDKPRPITPKKIRSTRPLDLILVVILTLLTGAFVLVPVLNETPIRTVLGILLVLFLPGYSLIAALFPRRTDLDSIERVALSFGLSIAVTPLIGLALNYTPWGIRLDPILICLVGFTLAMCLIAYLRRRTLPDSEKFAVAFGLFFRNLRRSFQAESRTEKILTIILILSILVAIGTVAFVVLQPKQGEKFTEFYLLGPDGKASNYPTNLTVGQNATVIVGVVNHEYATTNYQLVVRVDNNTLQEGNITLADKEKTEIPVSFTASTPGQKKMEFLLYKLPDTTNPYRTLHLWYQVS